MPVIPISNLTFTFSNATTNNKGWKSEKVTTFFEKVTILKIKVPTAVLCSPDHTNKMHHFNEAELDGKVYRDLVVKSDFMPCISDPKSKPANKFSKDTVSLITVKFVFGAINLRSGGNDAHFGNAALSIKQGIWSPYTEKVYVDKALVKGDKMYKQDSFPGVVKRKEIQFTIGQLAIPQIMS